jgi:hypothetical protein
MQAAEDTSNLKSEEAGATVLEVRCKIHPGYCIAEQALRNRPADHLMSIVPENSADWNWPAKNLLSEAGRGGWLAGCKDEC